MLNGPSSALLFAVGFIAALEQLPVASGAATKFAPAPVLRVNAGWARAGNDTPSLASLFTPSSLSAPSNILPVSSIPTSRQLVTNAPSTKPIATFSGQQSPFLPSSPIIPTKGSAKSYGDLLGATIWFYEAQRSGILPPNFGVASDKQKTGAYTTYSGKLRKRVSWRNSSTWDDGLTDNKVDLSGGYFDAGDYLKFTHTTAYTLVTAAYGATMHWRGLQATDNLGYVDQMLRWGFDWLMKAHVADTQLYVMVGSGAVDHDTWCGDQKIATPRPSLFVNATKPGTDTVALTAAAFAAGAKFYGSVIGNQTYAKILLTRATTLYHYAESAPQRTTSRSVPALREFYDSDSIGDKLALAALMLESVTNNTYFRQRAEEYFTTYNFTDFAVNSAVYVGINWSDVTMFTYLVGAQAEFARYAANGTTSPFVPGRWQQALEISLDQIYNKAIRTPGGLLWINDVSDDCSLTNPVSWSYVMSEYSRIMGSGRGYWNSTAEYPGGVNNVTAEQKARADKVKALSETQLDYVYGSNPAKYVYVVGVATNSVKNPQHAAASGGVNLDTMDSFPKEMRYTIYGAMVGGPSKTDTYQDRRSNWEQSEVANDYSAALLALLAAKVEEGDLPFFVRPNATTPFVPRPKTNKLASLNNPKKLRLNTNPHPGLDSDG